MNSISRIAVMAGMAVFSAACDDGSERVALLEGQVADQELAHDTRMRELGKEEASLRSRLREEKQARQSVEASLEALRFGIGKRMEEADRQTADLKEGLGNYSKEVKEAAEGPKESEAWKEAVRREASARRQSGIVNELRMLLGEEDPGPLNEEDIGEETRRIRYAAFVRIEANALLKEKLSRIAAADREPGQEDETDTE